jgi:D-apionolactonase
LSAAYPLWYGRDEPPIEPRQLRAGPLLVELHGPDLRYARSARNEVVRRVYMAIRDLNWNTLPATIGEPEIEDAGDAFRVRFDARTAEGDIDFAWTGTIEGSADGAISYELDGTAATDFDFAKIGLCLHHPLRESVGRLFRGTAPTTPVGGQLPWFIGPQINLADEGWDLPLFEPVEWLEIDLPHGERIRFDFEGDLFEMEDQRNWTDGSFKTSSTPASLGYHHTVQPGGRIRQKLTFRVEGPVSPSPLRARAVAPAVLRVGEPLGAVVPPIGLGVASHEEALGDRAVELLRELAPAHLRVDVRPGDAELLERAVFDASALGCALELALFPNGEARFLDGVAEAVRAAGVPIARVLVLADGREVSALEDVDLARERFPGIVVGGGTNVYFNELNRNRPDPDRFDVVVYSANPQIHAFDELSLVETFEAAGDTVRSARAFCGATPVAVTPITLLPRFNAVATVEEAGEAGGLPRQVDPRQSSLFAAGWTLGNAKGLAEAGVASLTYFETTGWRGVVERDDGSGSAAFPSHPGEPFPLYHVLADLCALRGSELRACESSDPLAVVGLAAGGQMLLANLEPRAKTVRLEGVAGPATLVRLDETTVPGRVEERVADVSTLQLRPFEVVRIDT